MATASIVLLQNARFTILWDASYVLENATRIAAGELPYRDFPFPYAPLTFIVQAIIIRIFGRAWWHHVAYAAIVGGCATSIAYTIVRKLVPRGVAIALTTPLILLGVYCIVPNPFYDPDCCFVMLLLFALLLTRRDSLMLGAAFALPLVIKQNIGLAVAIAAIGLFVIARRWRSAAGVVIGVTTLTAVITLLFGLHNYWRWTIGFAAARRLPPLAQQLAIYNDRDLWWWLAVVALSLFVRRARWLIAIPWLWSEWRLFVTDDPLEHEINFLRAWPLMIVIGITIAIVAWRRERDALRILPLLIVATILGAFLSQSTWGSTYGIWPLLILLLAIAFRYTFRFTGAPLIPAIVIAIVMLHHAFLYIAHNERLTYAKVAEGTMRPEFEELVAYAERNIPRDDAILSMPGEDLFYFTTGRTPRFPVLMFDRTINPYSPREIAALAIERDVRWVIVKKRLQLNGDPMPELQETLALLRPRFVLAATLRNYDVYKQTGPLPSTSHSTKWDGHSSSERRVSSLADRPCMRRRPSCGNSRYRTVTAASWPAL